MPPTDTSVLDYVVTYGGPSIFMTAVFVVVLPLVYFKFARPRYPRWPARLAVLLGVWLCAFVIAYGDVFLIARDAQRLCEQEAGLKVYRTVEAEGFAGVSSLSVWSKRGFQFVETIKSNGSSIQSRIEDGRTTSVALSRAQSRYEYDLVFDKHTSRIDRQVDLVRDRSDFSVLGEIVIFRPSLGWADAIFAKYAGASWSPLLCEGPKMIKPHERTTNFEQLIVATILPIPQKDLSK